MTNPEPILAPLLGPAELATLTAGRPEVRILDVRTPGEFETVHIRGAYNVPLDTLSEHSAEISGVSAPVILVCQSGGRARRAEQALKSAGMANLHVLEGGMNAWVAAGLPVGGGKRRLSLERQVRIVAGALAATGGILGFTVNPAFALIPVAVGSGLVFAGVTDKCGMALILSRLPYNRASCDVPAMVRALATGRAPSAVTS